MWEALDDLDDDELDPVGDNPASFLYVSEGDVSPFNESVKEGARTSRFFHKTDVNEHMKALKSGALGLELANFCETRKVKIEQSYELPENTEAMYVHPRFFKGVLRFGHMLNSLLLGHEIHHARQHLTMPHILLNPDSVQGQVLLDRFIEADARAVEFAVALQTIQAMRPSHKYSYNLIGIFDPYQKEICEYNIERLEEIAASPSELKQAMRRCFDHWISITPAQKVYEKHTHQTVDHAGTSKILRPIFNLITRGYGFVPMYTRDHLDPEYPQKLAEAFGNLSKIVGGNYLTETTGPAFDSPFYTRICNYRLERADKQMAKRL